MRSYAVAFAIALSAFVADGVQGEDATTRASETVERIVAAVARAVPDDTPFSLLVTLRAKPDTLDAVLASYRSQAEQAARNPGSRVYHVGQDVADPEAIILYEAWDDLDAFLAHERSAETLAHFARVGPWLGEERSLRIVLTSSPAQN